MLRNIFIALIVLLKSSIVMSADLVLVVGGTGGTGWETVKEALSQNFEVRATTTNVERARERYGEEGFEWVEMDVRILDDIRAGMKGVDYVISTIGGDCYDTGGPSSARHIDYQGVVNLAGISKDLGIKQFILTSALNTGVPAQRLNMFCDNVQMWKWLGEDYLRDGDLPYTIISPGGLGNDPGGKIGIAMAGSGAIETGFIQRADVAKVLVESIGNADTLGKTIEIVGDPKGKPDEWRKKFSEIPKDPPQLPPLTKSNVGERREESGQMQGN